MHSQVRGTAKPSSSWSQPGELRFTLHAMLAEEKGRIAEEDFTRICFISLGYHAGNRGSCLIVIPPLKQYRPGRHAWNGPVV